MADGSAPGLPAPQPEHSFSSWDEAIAAEILETVAVSPRALGWLCAANPHWPAVRTIRRWRDERPEFRNAFAAARRALADELAFESIEIADDASGDAKVIERRDGSTFTVLDQEFVARSKLRTEVRRWLAARLAPDVYGDKLDVGVRAGSVLSQEDALDQLR